MFKHVGVAAAILVGILSAGCGSKMPSQPSPVTTSATPAGTTATNHPSTVNQQIVFQDRAGTGLFTTANGPTHFGFWIWCQGTNSNAYGNDCAGSMYFYQLGITTGVNGSIDLANRTVSNVSTPPGGAVSCTFTLPDLSTLSGGPHNTVNVSCDTPAGTGSDSEVAIQVTPGS